MTVQRDEPDGGEPRSEFMSEDGRGSGRRVWLLEATTGLSLKLGLASALVVSVVIGAGALFAYHGEREQLLRGMREAASAQGRLVLTGLKSAMLDNNRTVLTDLISEYSRGGNVRRIYLVDATGGVALTTEPSWVGQSVEMPADLCSTCPAPSGEMQTRTEMIEHDGESVLRSLTVIPNEARCHRCHPEEQSFLGGLGVDFSMAAIHEARAAIIARTLQWGTAVCILVLLAVGAVVQLGALRRLRQLRDATRSLSENAGAPAAERGRDEIHDLADGIRSVSSSLQRSMAEVDFQRQFLVDLIDRMDDGVAVFDESLRVVAANKSYLTRIPRAAAESLPQALSCAGTNSLCLHDEAPGNCPTRRAFRSQRVEKGVHKRGLDGREVYYEVFASPIAGEGGAVEHVVEVWRDVTERTLIQANLAHSEQLATVGVLASGFSHEISTPLGTIATSIQGLLRRLRGREHLGKGELDELRSRLQVASDEVFRCRDITRSLLDISRKQRTAPDRLDVASVVTRMLEVVKPTAERQRVGVDCDAPHGVHILNGHSDQLEQLMLNLYVNAIEAMPDGGRLGVEVSSQNGSVEVVVSDTGCGMPPEERANAFQPFFTRKAGGTGLGLYLCRQVVEAHGGTIELTSPREGGTKLSVILPREVGAAQTQNEWQDGDTAT